MKFWTKKYETQLLHSGFEAGLAKEFKPDLVLLNLDLQILMVFKYIFLAILMKLKLLYYWSHKEEPKKIFSSKVLMIILKFLSQMKVFLKKSENTLQKLTVRKNNL